MQGQNTTKEDYAYSYTIALCKAIEQYTAIKETTDANIFIHDGLNFKVALQKALYFGKINNTNLLKIFKNWKENALPQKIVVNDQLEKELISILCEVDPAKIKISAPSLHKKIKSSIIPLVRWSIILTRIHVLADIVRKKINTSRKIEHKPKILFCIESIRFVRFLMPIIAKINIPFAVLTRDKKTADYLDDLQIPCILVSSFGYFLRRWSDKQTLLRQFNISDRHDLLFHSIQHLRPEKIVVVEGNSSHDEIINEISKSLGITSICIQQGWACLVHEGFRNMSYSKMLVWGEGFADILAPYNKDQHFIATGNQNVEYKHKTLKEPEKLTITFFLQGISIFLDAEKLTQFLNLMVWTNENFKDVDVLVREHPNYKLMDQIKTPHTIKSMPSETYSLQEVLDRSTLTVSIYSSTIFESIAMGVLPIIVNTTSIPYFLPDVTKYGAGIEVKNIDNAKLVISDFLKGRMNVNDYKDKMDSFRKKFFSSGGTVAIQNIIDEIVK